MGAGAGASWAWGKSAVGQAGGAGQPGVLLAAADIWPPLCRTLRVRTVSRPQQMSLSANVSVSKDEKFGVTGGALSGAPIAAYISL